MTKIVGLLAVFSSIVYAGVYFSSTYKKRVNELSLSRMLIQYFINEIRLYQRPLDVIISDAARSDGLSGLSFAHTCAKLSHDGLPFPAAWRKSLTERYTGALKKPDREILLQLGEFMGRSDPKGEEANLSRSDARLESQLLSAREEQDKKGGLIRKLSIFAGIAAVIVLI